MRNVWGADASIFLGQGEEGGGKHRMHISNNQNNYKINTKQPVGKHSHARDISD